MPFKIGIQRYDKDGKRRQAVNKNVAPDEAFRINTTGGNALGEQHFSMNSSGGMEVYSESTRANLVGNAWVDAVAPATPGFYEISAISEKGGLGNAFPFLANIPGSTVHKATSSLNVQPSISMIPSPPSKRGGASVVDIPDSIIGGIIGGGGNSGSSIGAVTSNLKWIVLGVGGLLLLSTARRYI